MKWLDYSPPWFLTNGVAMTVYTALIASRYWDAAIADPEPIYQPHIFTGKDGIKIYGIMATPVNARGTFVATYGITGDLDNQWFLKLLGRKAYAQGYAVVLFDWRAHGKTAELSPVLTSDGLNEGDDYVHIAAQAKGMGCPAPFWFAGYSLSGQLALWAVNTGQAIAKQAHLGLTADDIGGGAVICPSLDSNRSLRYLTSDRWGRLLEQSIVQQLKKLAWTIYGYHPQAIDPQAIERITSILTFDQELVIEKLGFTSVDEYYEVSSPFRFLPQLQKPTLILYAADDPLFDPVILPDLQSVCAENPALDLILTAHGGHVGYISSQQCQHRYGDRDPWWAWNRVLEWVNQHSTPSS